MINWIYRLLGYLNGQNLSELQEIHRLVEYEKFKLKQIKGNTALIPNGNELAEQQEALVNLLEGAKQGILLEKLKSAGCVPGKPVSVNMSSGKIIQV